MDAELKVSLQAIREQLEELEEQQAEVRYRRSQAVMKVLDERVQEVVMPRRAS